MLCITEEIKMVNCQEASCRTIAEMEGKTMCNFPLEVLFSISLTLYIRHCVMIVASH